MISQIGDANLCRILKYTIKFNETECMENLSLGDDNSELISELLEQHTNLTFLFEDAHGVITITQQAPGIFYRVILCAFEHDLYLISL